MARMSDGNERDQRHIEQAGSGQPVRWRFSDRLWQWSNRLTPRAVDSFLKVRSARSMPHAMKARFSAMLIPEETIDRALSEVHRLDDWVGAWSRAAQRFMAEARREEAAGEWETSAVARRNAAMCYHAAHLVTEDDPRIVRALRASAVQAFSQAVTRLEPGTRRVGIPWRTRRLPAYLYVPHDIPGPVPLVVMLNGATTTKEETFIWSQSLRDRGFAILALDWPGTGEAADGQPLSSYCDDMTEGIFDLVNAEPQLDPARVAFFGVSLGGVVALRSAVTNRRIAAAIAITPPYDPRPWIRSINPLVAQQLVSLAGRAQSVGVLVADFSLPEIVGRVRCPVLVFGAARDLVVPPDEAMKLTSALGELGTLVWYPDGAHGLYDRVDDWSAVAAEWLSSLFDLTPPAGEPPEGEGSRSTQVDDPLPAAPDAVAALQSAAPASEPVDAAEDDGQPGPQQPHDAERPPVAPAPTEFGDGREIHPVDAGDEGHPHQDDRGSG
jgi:alpha-beta hydrolase superfamily lysophospholipase